MDRDRAVTVEESDENPGSRSERELGLRHLYIGIDRSTQRGERDAEECDAVGQKLNRYARLDEEEVLLQYAPLAFDASTFELWGALLNGGGWSAMGRERLDLSELGEVVEGSG